jgi:hypothetical protein
MSFFPHSHYAYTIKLNLKYVNYTYYTYDRMVGLFTHEIGHALGLAHEHQRADSPNQFGQGTYGEAYGPYDGNSVMDYSNRPYTGGISAGDRAVLRMLYGKQIHFSHPVQHYPSGWNFGFGSAWEKITGDFNGDGKTDYARLGGTYSHFFLSNGNGTFSHPVHYYPKGWNFGNPSSWKTITGDFNGDGKSDYARLGGTYSHLFIKS